MVGATTWAKHLQDEEKNGFFLTCLCAENVNLQIGRLKSEVKGDSTKESAVPKVFIGCRELEEILNKWKISQHDFSQ